MNPAIMEKRMVLWYGVINEQKKSGLSIISWCTTYRVPRSSFMRWQKDIQLFIIKNGEAAFQKLVETYSNSVPIPTVPALEGLKVKKEEPIAFVELLPPPANDELRSIEKKPITNRPKVNRSVPSDEPSTISIQYGDFKIDLSHSIDENQLLKVLRVIKDVN